MIEQRHAAVNVADRAAAERKLERYYEAGTVGFLEAVAMLPAAAFETLPDTGAVMARIIDVFWALRDHLAFYEQHGRSSEAARVRQTLRREYDAPNMAQHVLAFARAR